MYTANWGMYCTQPTEECAQPIGECTQPTEECKQPIEECTQQTEECTQPTVSRVAGIFLHELNPPGPIINRFYFRIAEKLYAGAHGLNLFRTYLKNLVQDNLHTRKHLTSYV